MTPLGSPLTGARILVTRPAASSEGLMEALRRRGARPIPLPAVRFEPSTDPNKFESAVRQLKEADWVVFTSARGVEATLEALARLRLDFPAGRTRTAVIGPATRQALESHGVAPEFQPSMFLGATLGRELPLASGQRVVLLRAEIAGDDLPSILRERGARLVDVPAYRTVADEGAQARAAELLADRVDWILFTSASTVDHLAAVLGPDLLDRLQAEARVACIGPVTADAARRQRFRVDVVAATHTQDGLVAALESEAMRYA